MMSITTVSSWIYMCFIGVAEAPLGPRKVWPLLTIRGIAGAVASMSSPHLLNVKVQSLTLVALRLS
jgi:hypothetical protein